MKALKFRAWSEETKSFEHFDLYEGTECGLTNLQIWAKNNPIEQYTGLKDKNGKEICEGDIVRLYEHNWWDGKIVKHHKKPRIEGNFVVFYDADTAAFEMENTQPYDNGIRGEEPFGLASQEYEIIGNIHEREEEK